MSPEIRLMVSPRRTYASLAARSQPIGWIRALGRPALVAVVLGTSMALSSTGHATPSLVFSTTLLLSFVVIGQVVIALAVIPGGRTPTAGRARSLDLFFASHAPWSLWLLLSAVLVPSPFGLPVTPLRLAAIVPIVLTPRMIDAYFREIHGLDRRRAAIRTIVHQAVTWGLFVGIFGAAVAVWPRILQALR